jgi:hypothetical protein
MFSFAEVLRFTGLGRRAVVELIGAGAVEEVLGARVGGEISAPALRSWLAEHATGVCSAGVNGVTTAEPAEASELSCISDRPRLLGPWLSGRVVGLDPLSIYF